MRIHPETLPLIHRHWNSPAGATEDISPARGRFSQSDNARCCRILCVVTAVNKQLYEFLLLASALPVSTPINGRAITQAVSPWRPTAAARVRARIRSCGICGGKVALVHVFSQYFGFACQLSFHRLLHTLIIIRDWYSRQNSGRCNEWTQFDPTPTKKIKEVKVVPVLN
jgi:hypothetical protein